MGLVDSDRHLTKTHDNPRKWNREAKALGKRFKVFCASLSDVFEPHPQVAEARLRLWTLIEETRYLDWQLLTQRPKFRGGYFRVSKRSTNPGVSAYRVALVRRSLPAL